MAWPQLRGLGCNPPKSGSLRGDRGRSPQRSATRHTETPPPPLAPHLPLPPSSLEPLMVARDIGPPIMSWPPTPLCLLTRRARRSRTCTWEGSRVQPSIHSSGGRMAAIHSNPPKGIHHSLTPTPTPSLSPHTHPHNSLPVPYVSRCSRARRRSTTPHSTPSMMNSLAYQRSLSLSICSSGSYSL